MIHHAPLQSIKSNLRQAKVWAKNHRQVLTILAFVLIVALVITAVLLRMPVIKHHIFNFASNVRPTAAADMNTNPVTLQQTQHGFIAHAAAQTTVSFAQEIRRGSLLGTVTRGDHTVSFSMPDNRTVTTKTNGNTATIPDIKDGLSLRYDTHEDFVKETITLSKPQDKIDFVLTTAPDLRLTQNQEGGIEIRDSKGTLTMYIQPLVAHDAAGADQKYAYQLAPTNNGYTLSILPLDPKKTANAAYPITIDPTISWSFALSSDYTISNAAEVQVSGNTLSLKNNSGYPTDNPYAYTNNGVPYTTLSGFSQALDATNQGTVQYQLSKDKTTWYYWNGSTWATATPSDYNQSNPADIVNSNISTFATQLGTGNLYIKAFLHATSSATPVALDSFTVTYTGPSAPALTGISSSGGTTAGGTNVTLTGSNFANMVGTGGNITYTGGNTIHTFTSSGTFTLPVSSTVDVLVVGGGGGGGMDVGGGGGGGGFRQTTYSVAANTPIAVTVGGGGAGATSKSSTGARGGSSVFGTITVLGGGGGKSVSSGAGTSDGASGGGGTYLNTTGGGATSDGHVGGNAATYGTGGGGGAGTAGSNGTAPAVGGNGGAGAQSSISGSAVYYAGGGGGGGGTNLGTPAGYGTGGSGGGGNGTMAAGTAPGNGAPNTGGGGGGQGGTSGSNPSGAGGSGGSGIVIVRYPMLGTSLTFGGTPATNVSIVNPTTITATTPAHAPGTVDVVETNPDGQSATLANAYTFAAPPSVTAITPATGENNQQATGVTISGNYFTAGASVKLAKSGQSDIPCTNQTTAASTIICDFDLRLKNTGAWDVVVVNPDGQTATLSGGFTITPAIVKLVYLTTPIDIVPGASSSRIVVQAQDFLGNAIPVSSTTTLALSSISVPSGNVDTNGQFSLSNLSWSSVNTITLSPGQSSATFYYKNTAEGTYQIVTSESPPKGWTDPSLTIGVSASAPYTWSFDNDADYAHGSTTDVSGSQVSLLDSGLPTNGRLPTYPDLTGKKVWYVSATNGVDATGDGSSSKPYATFNKALAMSANGDAIKIMPGTYRMAPDTSTGVALCLYDGGKNLTIVGSNSDSVLNCYGSDSTTRDAHVAQLTNSASVVSNMYINFYPNRSSNYSNSIFGWTTGTFRNLYVENKSTTQWSYEYDNSGLGFSVINSTFKSNGYSTSDYSGSPTYKNVLFDAAPSNGTKSYTLTRTITAGDLDQFNIPSDVKNLGDPSITNPDGTRSHIGTMGGTYAWSQGFYPTDTSLDFSTAKESQFIQADAANGTDFLGGKLTLHDSGTGGAPGYPDLTGKTVWYVSATGNDTTGDGSLSKPFANFSKALASASNGNAIKILPGTYHILPDTSTGRAVCFYDGGKSLTIVGSDSDSVLNCYGSDSATRDANVAMLTNAASSLSNMQINYYPNRSTNYSNAIFAWTTGTYKNLYIENKSTTTNWSYEYDNNNTAFTVINCAFKANGRSTGDYSGNPTYKNDLFDAAPSGGTKTYSITRTITANDTVQTSLPADLKNMGDPALLNPDGTRSNIGVAGGPYAWGSSIYATAQPYTVTTSNQNQIKTGLPWTHMTGVTITQGVPQNTAIKWLVSFDGRSTWKYWNGSSWSAASGANVDAQLATNGMTDATINGLTEAQWMTTGGLSLGQTLDFAMSLQSSSSMATPWIDQISIGYKTLAYDTSNPTITNVGATALPYSTLTSFTELAGTGNAGSFTYQFSKDGTNWYWWDSGKSKWVTASGYAQSNNAAVVNANIAQLPTDIGPGDLYFKVFLHAADYTTTTQLDAISVGYTYHPGPTLTSVLPTSGLVTGGDTMTISGSNFYGTPSVSFGGVPSNSVTVIDANTLQVVVPSVINAGTVDIQVSNPDGRNATLAAAYTYRLVPPNLASITPDNGAAAGKTTVTLTGDHFYGAGPASTGGDTSWTKIAGKTLPGAIYGSQIAVIGNTIYSFGGFGGSPTNVIYSAPVSDPTTWTNTGKTLPGALAYSQLAIVGNTIYLFGGHNGASASKVIYSAPVSDPTTWTNTGKTLPGITYGASLAIVNNKMYLYGGSNGANLFVIYSANTSDPTMWTDTGKTLPNVVFGSQLAVIGNSMYLYAGTNAATQILSAPVSDPTTWTNTGKTLPNNSGVLQFAAIGDYLYLYGGTTSVILRATVSDPTAWSSLASTIPSTNSWSQVAIIDNYVYLFGGSASGNIADNGIYRAPVQHLSDNQYNASWKTNWPITTLGPASVSFGGTPATKVVVVNPTTITATTPAHASGAVDVTETNADGQSTTLSSAYTFNPGPGPFTISPSTVSKIGGNSVAITGSNFLNGATVSFGGVPAQSVTFVSSNILRVITPAQNVGTYDVVVTNPDGQTATLTQGITVTNLPPTILSMTPNAGSTGGGTSVTISGENFAPGATVTFGGLFATNVKIVDPNTITLTTPAHAQGAVDVVVTNADGLSFTLTSGYMFNPPPGAITVSPSSVPRNGGYSVIISGSNLISGATVTFGGVAAQSVTFVDASTLNVITPAQNVGTYDVVVTNPDGQKTTLTGGMTFTEQPPVASSITANSGLGAGGTNVTITGQNFSNGATVSFGGRAATNVQIVNITTITATTPSHTLGTIDVVVTNPDGQKSTLAKGFTYLPDKYVFVSSPLHVRETEPGAVTLQAQDLAGNAVSTDVAVTIPLSTTATTGFFARDLTEDASTRWNYSSIILPAGSSQITFYYKDNLKGTPTITAAGPGAPAAQQTEQVVSRYRLLVTGVTNPVRSGIPSSVTIQAVDYSGQPLHDYTGTVHFTSSDGSAVIPSDYTITANNLGGNTFVNGVTMVTQGTWCVTATDTRDADITGSQCGIVVTPPFTGTISKLSFITAPASFPVDGQTNPITVQTQDDSGAPIPVAANKTIYLRSDSTTGQFSLDSTTWNNGPQTITIRAGTTAASFYYRDPVIGQHQITAADDATANNDFGWTNATQTVTATVGSAYRLHISPPSSLAAGQSGVVRISQEDMLGNSVPALSPQTVYATTVGSAVFSYSGNFATDAVSTAHLTIPLGTTGIDVYFKDTAAGLHTIQASDATPPNGDVGLVDASATVSVVAAAPAALGFTTQATQVIAGALSPAITAGLYDQYGNLATAAANTTIYLSGTQTGLQFYNTAGTQTISSVTIAAGQSTADFTFKQMQLTSLQTLTISDHAGTPDGTVGLDDASQNEVVTPGTANKYAITSAVPHPTAGVPTGSLTASLQNQYGVTIPSSGATPLYLSTTSIGGSLSLDGNTFAPTIASTLPDGQSSRTFYYKDTIAGTATITAADEASGLDTGLTNGTQDITTAAAEPAGVRIISTAQTTQAGQVSAAVGVRLEDQYGNATVSAQNTTVRLDSNSTSMRFDTAAGGAFNGGVTSVIIPAGQQSAPFYYKDTVAGSPQISVAANGMTGGAQTETITSGTIAGINLNGGSNIFAGQVSGALTATAVNAYGAPIAVDSDTTVTLHSDATTGRFDTANNGAFDGSVTSVSIPAGQQSANFYYKDTVAGSPVITASAIGLTDGTLTMTITWGTITQLIINGGTTAAAGQATSAITVTAANAYGVPVKTTANTIINLKSNASSGRFDTANNGAFDGSITSVTIPAGQQSVTFYYKDTVAGSPVITASASGLTDGTQTETIDWGTAGSIAISGANTAAAGQSSGTLHVAVRNTYGAVMPVSSDTLISLSTNAATGRFDTASNGAFDGSITSVTIPAGQNGADFYYKDTKAGAANVTATTGAMNATVTITVDAGAPATFVATTLPQATEAGQVSSAITFTLQDSFGNTAHAAQPILVNLSSGSGSMRFDTSASGAFNGSVTTVTIPAGQQSVTFYYKDTVAGSPQVIVGATGINTASQTETVTWGAVTKITLTGASTAIAGQASAGIVVAATNAYSVSVMVDSDTVVGITSNAATGRFDTASNGAFDGSITSVTILAGQSSATFYYNDTRVGTPVITATESGLQATRTITVQAGAPAQLTISSAPQTLQLGQKGTFTVRLEDVHGNAATTASDTVVNLGTTSGTGQFTDGHGTSGTAATILAGSSTATFTYQDTTTGTPNLSVDASGLTGSNQTVTIVYGTPTQFSMTAGSNTLTAGQPSAQLTVYAVNAYAQVVPVTSDTTLQLSSTSPTGTFATTAGGSFTLTNITILAGNTSAAFYYKDTATGSPTISAARAGMGTATYAFNISAGAPATFLFLTQPVITTAGNTSAAITVSLRDAFGNPTTATSDMAVSVQDSESATKVNASASGPWTDNPFNAVILTGGQTLTFFYRGTVAGSQTLTVHAAGMTDTTQNTVVSPAALDHLGFTTSEQTIFAKTASSAITITGYDQFNNQRSIARPDSNPLRVNLNTGSVGGTFSLSSSSWMPTTAVVIPYNAASQTFYYQDTVIGNTVISAQDVQQTYPLISQNITVTPGNVAKLRFTTAPQTIVKDTPSQPINISLADQNDYLTSDNQSRTVHVASSSTGGELSLDSTNWSSSLDVGYSAGTTTQQVYYRDSKTGSATLTASTSGLANGTQGITIIPGVIAKLSVAAASQVTAGQATPVVVQTATIDDQPAAVGTDTTIQLTGASGGEYSLSSSAWTPVTSVVLKAGQYQKTIYYRNTTAGTDIITANVPSSGWSQGSASIVVTTAAATKIVLASSPASSVVGSPSGQFVAEIQDQFGNIVLSGSDRILYLSGAASATFATDVAGPWTASSATIAAGTNAATFYYNDSIPGAKTFTVSDTIVPTPDTGLTNATASIVVASLPPSKVQFTSNPQTITAGQKSSAITVSAIQSNDQPAVLGTPLVINLSSNNAGGAFYASATSQTPITTATIPIGGSAATIYYRSTLAATTSSLTATAIGVGGDTQTITVQAAAPAQLAFVTATQTKSAGVDSDQMRVQLQDAFGNPSAAQSDITVALQTTSQGGSFSVAAGASWSPITTATIATGSNDLYLYYHSTINSTDTLRIHPTLFSAISDATQNFAVTSGSAVQLHFVTAAQNLLAGQPSSTMNVQLQDQYGNIVLNPSDLPVYLASNISDGIFSTTLGFSSTTSQVTMLAGSGQVGFYYKSVTPGSHALTASDIAPPDSPDAGLANATQTQTITMGAPDKLAITGNSSTPAGQAAALTVHLQNLYGVEITSSDDTTIYFGATNGGQFSLTSDFASTVTSAVLARNSSTLQFYYRNVAAGASTIAAADQASGADVGLQDGSVRMAVLPGAVARLHFLTPAPNLEAGQPSGAIIAQTQDVYGNVVPVPGGLAVHLTTESATGEFSSSNDFTTTITQIAILPGGSTASFYYKDVKTGTSLITAADNSPATPDTGLENATQQVVVTAGAITQLTWLNHPTIEAGQATQLSLQTQNAYGVPTPVASDTTIYLENSSATAGFSTTSGGPWTLNSIVLPAGQSDITLYYRSTGPVNDTLTAADTNPATPDTGIQNAVQTIGVLAGTPTQLAITSPAFSITARHTSPAGTIEARNAHGAATGVTTDTPIYLRTSGSNGEFAAASDGPWGVNYIVMPANQTDISFYYHDPNVGTPVVIASDNLPIDPDTDLTNATQQETITPQVVDHLLVTNISTPQMQGSPSSIVVEAQDDADYIVSDYTGTISFTSSDADAIIPGPYTFSPSTDKGIHTFTNASAFLHAGTKSVTATDAQGITGTQSGIEVTSNIAGPVANVRFISPTPPMLISKNTASATITVQTTDAQGRPSNAPEGGYLLRLTSSSATGEYATSPSGPWTANATVTIPTGLNSANVYYRDSTVGTYTLTASDWQGSTDDPTINNGTLTTVVAALNIALTTTLQVQNNSHYYEPSPILFSKNSNGDYYAQADFVTAITDETSGQAVNANITYALKDPTGKTVDTQTAVGKNYTYHVQPIQGTMKQGNYTLNVTATDPVRGVTSTTSTVLTLSGWSIQVLYDPDNRALGQPLPYTISTKYDGVLADAPDFSVTFRDDNGDNVTAAVTQTLKDLTHTGTGQYSGSIPTTGLLPTDAQFNNAYYLYTYLYQDNNPSQKLAEDNHFDIFFQNNPALAPKNFHVEKVLTSTPPADETYNLTFNWDASQNASKYVLYRSRNKSATLFTDPCSVDQVKYGHRFGDAGATTPFCETQIQQNVGTDDTTQWVQMAEVNAPSTSATIPWSQLRNDASDTYYYLVRAQNGAGESGYSTMVFTVKKHFVTNTAPLTSINWLALPYNAGNFTNSIFTAQKLMKASDIVKDIEGGLGSGKNQKISRVALWVNDVQSANNTFNYNLVLKRWTGDDFTINPGDAVYLQTTDTTGFDWTVVGSDATSTFTLRPNSAPLTNINWLSIPYSGKYQKASDIIKDIEGSMNGAVGNDRNRFINRVALWSNGVQSANDTLSYNTAFHRWTGADFDIHPGDAVYLQLSGGQLSFQWIPPLIINPYN